MLCIPFCAKVLQSQTISKQCDVYSYGIVLWELLTHKLPFEDVSNYAVTKKVVEDKEVSNFMILAFSQAFPHLYLLSSLVCKYKNKVKLKRLGTISMLIL